MTRALGWLVAVVVLAHERVRAWRRRCREERVYRDMRAEWRKAQERRRKAREAEFANNRWRQ